MLMQSVIKCCREVNVRVDDGLKVTSSVAYVD